MDIEQKQNTIQTVTSKQTTSSECIQQQVTTTPSECIQQQVTKPCARLEEWSPFNNGLHLNGVVYGHKRLPDGVWITTSRIIKLDMVAGVCETVNTTYQLGKAYVIDKGETDKKN